MTLAMIIMHSTVKSTITCLKITSTVNPIPKLNNFWTNQTINTAKDRPRLCLLQYQMLNETEDEDEDADADIREVAEVQRVKPQLQHPPLIQDFRLDTRN